MSQVLFLSVFVLAFCGVALTFGKPHPDEYEYDQANFETAYDDNECIQEAGLDSFIGKWVEVASTNKEPMLDAAGITGARRESLTAHKSVRIYKRNEGVWTVYIGNTDSPELTEINFKLGEPFESQNPDGTLFKSVVVQIGSTLVGHHDSKEPNKLSMTIVREVHGDSMISTTLSFGLTVKIIYKRV